MSEVLQHQVDALLSDRPRDLSAERAAWLFALCARLEKPLLPGVAAALRALLRHCSDARDALQPAERPGALPRLNLLVAVAGGYFGQDELLCKRMGVPDFQELL